MSKNMLVALLTLIILALGLGLGFDAFKVLAVLGFAMALDMQIVVEITRQRMKKLREGKK